MIPLFPPMVLTHITIDTAQQYGACISGIKDFINKHRRKNLTALPITTLLNLNLMLFERDWIQQIAGLQMAFIHCSLGYGEPKFDSHSGLYYGHGYGRMIGSNHGNGYGCDYGDGDSNGEGIGHAYGEGQGYGVQNDNLYKKLNETTNFPDIHPQ